MRFSDIAGHEEAKDRLRSLADGNRIPHAILLEGPEGIGKLSLARAFLQYVNCTNRQNGDSCGVCPNCRQAESLQYIDTLYSFPYAKRKNSTKDSPTLSADYLRDFIDFVKESPYADKMLWLEKLGMPNTNPQIYVEEANELIRRLSFAPNNSKYKSVIIWQGDSLNEAASNKLLKLIEEPPGEAIIIMTSDKPGNILPTIYSRMQRIKLNRLPDSEVVKFLSDYGLDGDANPGEIARIANGSITSALRILAKSAETDVFLEYFISLMRLAYQRDIAALKDWAMKVSAEKRERLVDFLEYMGRLLRENFIANLHDASLNSMLPAEADFSRKFSRFVNERNVVQLLNEVSKAISDIRGNVNARIVLFDLAITVILLLKQ